jgi:hypothetical protein
VYVAIWLILVIFKLSAMIIKSQSSDLNRSIIWIYLTFAFTESIVNKVHFGLFFSYKPIDSIKNLLARNSFHPAIRSQSITHRALDRLLTTPTLN